MLLSLTACGALRPQIRTELVDFPVVVYAELPEQLTAPLAEPPPPVANCTLRGQPAVCAEDGLLQIDAWRTVVQRCNVDRESAARITSEAPEPQPGVTPAWLRAWPSQFLRQAESTIGTGNKPWN